MAKKTERTKSESSGVGTRPTKDMPRFLIPTKGARWVASYAGLGLELHLTDEETSKPLHFVLCGADLRELIETARHVLAEQARDAGDDSDDD